MPDHSPLATLDIDPGDFVLMGSLSGVRLGSLSPFNESTALPRPRIKELVQQGILDSKGHVRSEYANAWSVLAAANRVTRVQLVGSSGIFEYYAYLPDKGKPVSLKTVAGKLRIEDPAATDDALLYLADMVGSSNVFDTEFYSELDPADALVFAGLVDEQRRRSMKQLADGSSNTQSSTTSSIEAELNRAGEHFISLSSIVRSVTGIRETPSATEISGSVESLLSNEHIRRKGKGFQLASAGMELSRCILNIESVLTLLTVREVTSGTREQAGFNCAIGGLHSLLSVENVKGTVHFETLTSRALLELVGFFLREGLPVSTTQSELRSSTRFCGSCGTPRSAEDRFCVSCGAALQKPK